MNKFKIGDRVKTNSEMDVLKYGIISVKDYHIVEDSLYLTYGLKCHESVEFNERDLELVESSEEIAVKKFKEKIRNGIQKEMDYISKHYKEIANHQRCTLELQYCMQLLESEDK